MSEAAGPSMVAENYLASMFRLDEEGEAVTVAKLAEMLRRSPPTERLGLALPSVLGMLRRLAKDGLIEITGEKTVRFTPRGQQIGVSVVRRHRLAECLLADVLHVDLALVHTEAHRLEHAISPAVEERIDAVLGRPASCPFGYPIPGNAPPRRSHGKTLGQVTAEERWQIDRIPEDDTRLLEYLVSNGLLPNTPITVREVAPYKGTMTLDVDHREVVIGLQVAGGIRVRRPE
ncbi:MAG: metal-dependent transcriptional regulator [Chloroflexi bacterium]|nr:metal-dependent transcriptional regulator [Chloroflexota bacterium]